MLGWIIALLVWLIGAPLTYFGIIRKMDGAPWEKFMASLSWPAIILLSPILFFDKPSKEK